MDWFFTHRTELENLAKSAARNGSQPAVSTRTGKSKCGLPKMVGMLLLSESLPEFANELKQLLTQQGEDALASEVPTLTIVDRCRCGDDFCSGFYTAPKPNGAYGPGHRNVLLDPAKGMIILDVVSGSIQFVEVLYREDVKQKLDMLLS